MVQISLFLLFNAGVWGLTALPLILPVLIPSASHGRTVGNAYAIMEHMLSEGLAPLLPLAVFLIIGALFGRVLCGWACPFGLVQDLAIMIRRRPARVAVHTHRSARRFKYYVLGAAMLVSWTLAITVALGVGSRYKEALGYLAAGPFTSLSPSETLFSLFPMLLIKLSESLDPAAYLSGLPWFFWARIVILIGVLLLISYVPRGWCRYLCPVGAFSSLFSRFSLLGLRIDRVKCTRCGECVRACPMMVRILDLPAEKIVDPECIYCLRCLIVCPEGAVKPMFP